MKWKYKINTGSYYGLINNDNMKSFFCTTCNGRFNFENEYYSHKRKCIKKLNEKYHLHLRWYRYKIHGIIYYVYF